MSQILCKLRCMSIDHRHDKSVVQLYAVTDGGKDEENAIFWKYTPSAEASLEYPKGEVPELFESGKTYFLHMHLTESRDPDVSDWSDPELWLQDWNISIRGAESREYHFSRLAYSSDWGQKHGHVAPFNGALEMWVDNPKAFETLGLEGGRVWKFTFSKAPESFQVYINGEHAVLRETSPGAPVTFEQLVQAAGLNGGAWVAMQSQLEEDPIQVEEDSFTLQEHAFYTIKSV